MKHQLFYGSDGAKCSRSSVYQLYTTYFEPF